MNTKIQTPQNDKGNRNGADARLTYSWVSTTLLRNHFNNAVEKNNTSFKRAVVLFLGILMFFLSLNKLWGQTNIARYSFVSSSGVTYSPITGGTVATSGTYDDWVSNAIAMGGTFNYGGTNFTTCFISSNGFITFGGAAATTNYTPLSSLGTTTGAISAFGQDGAGSTATGASPEIRYQNTGTEFVVQFKDHSNFYNRTTERLNFQIRLTFASGQINIIYGNCTSPGTSSVSGTDIQVGVRGNSVTHSTNVNNLQLKNIPTGTTCNWGDAVAGFANNSSLLFSGTTNVNMSIPNGLKYAWGKQTAVAPVRTIAAPNAITISGATISWTAAAGATKYDVQYRIAGTCSWTNWTGNPISTNSVILTGLNSSTTYQVRIKSSNATVGTYYSHIPGTIANSDGYTSTGTFTTLVNCTPPVGAITPSTNISVCSPATSVVLGLNSNSSITAYQWLLNGTAIAGATSSTFTATASGNYSVVTNSGVCASTFSSVVNINTSPSLVANVNPATVCEGAPINLSATAVASDTNYTVNSVAYSRVLPTGAATVLASNGTNNLISSFTGNMDDGYWSGIPLPFNFNFYGGNYSNITISTNGNVQFGNSLTTTWVVSPSPTVGVPDNYIGAPWVDLDLSSTSNTSKVEYFTNGTTPNRQFVINWYAPLFGSTDKDTCQLVLFEGSNHILVNLATFINNSHQKTLGVENVNGTVAAAALGRNGTYWQTIQNESWLFKRGTFNYSWSGPLSFSSSLQNSVIANASSSASGNYSVTVSDNNGCSATATVMAVVNKAPVLTCPVNITLTATSGCSAIANFTASAIGSPAPVITYSHQSGTYFNVGITTVTVIANNACGADTCSFSITVLPGSINNWIGGTSTDWFDAANWCAGVPNINTDVQVASGAVFMPVIGAAGATCKSISINTNAALTMHGNASLAVSGNWNLTGTFNSNGGTVSFVGSNSQNLTGTTSFYNFLLNNTSGLVISSDVTISNTALLMNGNVTTGSQVFYITNTGSLTAQSGHINGFLKKYIPVGTGVVEYFEIGNGIISTPISLFFNEVTSSGTLTVNTMNGDHSLVGTSGFDATKTINRTWTVVNSGVLFDYYSMELNVNTADFDPNFSANYASTKVYTNGNWNDLNVGYADNSFINVDQATMFGTFQIGMFNPVPEVYLITPDFGYVGAAQSIEIYGRGFISNTTTVNSMPGITINSVNITSDTTLTLVVTIASNAAIGTRSVIVTNPSPYGGSSDPANFTVRTIPVANFYANSTTVSCYTNAIIQFTNYSTDGATYAWSFGAGATPATATGFGPHNVSYSTTGLKTVSLIAFSPIGNDTLIRTNFINVSASAPAAPTSIVGPTSVCSYGTNNVTYNIPQVFGVTSYNWTIPAGMNVVSGLGTRSIVVNFSSTFNSGVLSVVQSNPCGTSVAKSITINRAPAMPASITGPTMVCGLTTATYTAATVSGATSYVWTLPAGITSSAGVSPVTTLTNTISVAISSTFASGSITVKSSNACSVSSVRSISISRATSTPGVISGPALVCGLTTATYSIAAVTGATGYTWILPTGVTSINGSSPIVTTSTSITVNFAASFNSGSITVKANNACTSGPSRSLIISKAPSAPGVISGPTAICTLTSANYSISAVNGASSYSWTLPVGVTTTTGANTLTTITPSISVVITTAFVSGTITVKANGACATSAARTLVLGNCLRSTTIINSISDGENNPVSVKIYPNPNNGVFNVVYVSEVSSELMVEIYDVQGRLVLSQKENIMEGENLFNYRSVITEKGMYFLKLVDVTNNFIETKNLIIQ